jgi:XTP/dITP diphosphohydrolase
MMAHPNRWVLASSNPGKLREFQHALQPLTNSLGLEIVNQSELGVPSPEEPFHTFEENALVKARHASQSTGLPALADDSGICVDALGGGPGVRSARYWADSLVANPEAAGHRDLFHKLTTDEANLAWLLAQMSSLAKQRFPNGTPPDAWWNAQYVAAIAWVAHAEDPSPILVRGIWHGRLLPQGQGRGTGGFGYDRHFFDSDLSLTAAEMTLAQKQSVGHRGRALALLLQQLSINR